MALDASGNVGHTSGPLLPPRRLSTHQKAVLIQVLLAFPDETVSVCYLPSTSDALIYAGDFSTIFKAVNWTVVPAQPAEELPNSPSGLAIVFCEEKLPPSAEALRDVLRIYGIEAKVARDESNLCGTCKFALAVTEP
jgi:hypothetical protein